MRGIGIKSHRARTPKTAGGLEEARWEGLVTHDGLFVVDRDQRVTHWSPNAQRVLGCRAEDTLGRPCYEVVGGRDARNFRFCRRNCPVVTNARRGRATPAYDLLCTIPTGEERWLNVTVAVAVDGRRRVRILHLVRDVTRRRRIEEFARKAGDALRSAWPDQPEPSGHELDPSPTPLPRLSRRELEVLRMLAAGMSTTQIAENLVVQPVTARNHVARLLMKLGVANRLQAVVYASARRLI